MTQLDLFEWAANRPTAKILDAIPRIAKRMWAERLDPIAAREGTLVPMPLRHTEQRKSA
ncbi:hypothetical protein GRZ55_11685 [Chelativorans sp. ZYF759]|uniref:hypothetical protein n=1 Tax=Chelativorans sp. ZYF759 TaxID=2692213 RepID=UPI00145D76C6|nr:hypothetical protein [Chelativorans sp. ZYF759]NMG39905.1 hypothetical protein [Chelativorans sp. ZYF759]